MKAETKRNWQALFVWLALMTGIYLTYGFTDWTEVFISGWVCLIVGGILVIIWERLGIFSKEPEISEEDRKRFEGYDFLGKGRKQYVEKRFEDALANLDRAIECGIGDKAYAMRADCLQALDYHLETIEDYDRAILQEPEDCNLRFLRSCSKNAICDDEGALIDLQEAIELSKIDNELNRSYAAVARESGYQGHTALYEMDLIKAKSDKDTDEELRQELRRRKLARNSKRRKK